MTILANKVTFWGAGVWLQYMHWGLYSDLPKYLPLTKTPHIATTYTIFYLTLLFLLTIIFRTFSRTGTFLSRKGTRICRGYLWAGRGDLRGHLMRRIPKPWGEGRRWKEQMESRGEQSEHWPASRFACLSGFLRAFQKYMLESESCQDRPVSPKISSPPGTRVQLGRDPGRRTQKEAQTAAPRRCECEGRFGRWV